MVQLLSPATVPWAGRIVACSSCGYAHALRPLGERDSRLVVDCGERTLVVSDGAVFFDPPRVAADLA
jgi:hypothetical protein